ncbi:myopalladin isoform X4 [Mugil cephalus]|uniref:myopalladin isoform X4 n=1 Tax=Mugil cephalus TaxID=48193 RepID=UPI001FB6183D|nr:myopalladin isoform X4 [Mugil cephalus]
MQENNIDQPPSLSQLLRENYLAEARAQQRHSEMSRSDASSSRLQIYGSLKGKAEDAMSHNDPQFPDLSAFLSQEELDESVNLACQAIGHDPREERAEVKVPVTPVAPSSVSSASVSCSATPSVPFLNPSPAPSAAPPAVPFAQPEFKELPAANATYTADRKVHKASTRQDNMIRNSRDSGEGFHDYNRSSRSAPYGLETQSKKEFLNKAADFIEELSSLFKANSSKRVRPRSCKTHRSRSQNKAQNDEIVYPLASDNRERSVMPAELEKEGPSPAVSHQPAVQLDSGTGHVEFQDFRITEEPQYNSVPQEVEEEAEDFASTETPYAEEPVCEPPQFIQKLKSREVPEGSKMQLDCIVRGLPVPEVRWFCEGKELENSPDIQIITNGELHSLIIAEAFEEDTGRYSCFASNFYGTDSTSAEIYVEGASSSDSDVEQHFEHVAQLQRKQPQTPSSLPPPSSQTLPAEEEDSVSSQPAAATEEPAEELFSQTTNQVVPEPLPPVQISASVPPLPEFSQVAVASTAHPVQEEATVLPVQVFTSTSSGDAGLTEVQRVLTAPLGLPAPQTVQTAIAPSLPLNSAPAQTIQPESQTSNHNYPQGLNGQPIMAAPVFTKSLQDLLASEGQLVVLECRVKGSPSPRVDWYREGTLIDDSPDFRILQKKPRSPAESEEICTLVIAEVFPEDSGVFTCTANNKYGTVSSTAALRVKGNGSNSNHVRPLNSLMVKPGPMQEHFPPAPAVNPHLEVAVTSSIKPHSSTIRLDPLISSTVRLDPLNTSTLRLDPHSSSMLRPDPLRTSLPSLEPSSLTSSSSLNARSTSTPNLDPLCLNQQDHPGSIATRPESQSGRQYLSYPRPFVASSAAETSAAQEVPRPSVTSPDTSPKVKGSPNHLNGTPIVIPLPDPPPNSCLKTGTMTNHKHSRSGSRVGLRVHFKLPEDEEEEQSDASFLSDEDPDQASANKEPPPVLAKPKLGPAQLQLLHNQVLMEQQQDTDPPAQTRTQPQHRPPFQVQVQPEVQSSQEGPLWSPRMHQSPVPLLHELAAEFNSSAASSPTIPPFPPPTRILPTRVLRSPTSPPSFAPSPTPGSAPFHNSVFALRAQSPPQAPSPTSSSSSPSPIQNPVAFLSSVLPSLSHSQPTNSMGLPRGAPLGLPKKAPKMRPPSAEELRESRESILHDIEKKLNFKDETPRFTHQQKPSNEGKTASRPLGPNIPATVINYDEEYKVSNFEQRLMSEIEFRLERTPVEESDDEVQHDDVPSGKCIAPIFDKKLKNFRAMEGVPVTFSCKVVGVPLPKVYWFKDGKQILRKNVHYKKIREGDGTCALHIESTTSDDDGNYTIMAANPQGRISCSGHLIVQTGPPRNRMTPIHSQRVRSRIQEVESEQTEERFFRPHFLQAPGDMLAHEGRLCRLDCKVSGLPNPELMWLVNGKPIYPDLYHKMLVRENGIHSLIIDPLTQNDAGTYTCIASNKAGQSSFSLELKVVEKEMKHPPQFLEKLQNMGIPEGTPVRLECRVVGMPAPAIYWKKDNETIPKAKDRFSVTQDATGYVCLLIQPTRKEDAGWYTVSAKNEAGVISCTCRLDIYAQWHQNIPAPMKKAPRTGSRYAALTGQGLDIRSAFPTSDTSPILFSSSPPEARLESEEL